MQIIDKILARFDERGHLEYGESVTQLDHALQTAALAVAAGADDHLVSAALLHDFGHLLHDEEAAESGYDARHEEAGANFLATYFVEAAVEPGRLHVQAKRYLCAVDATYFSTLSAASVRSLELQGGPFSAAEATSFAENPHFRAALTLRRWDDLGKQQGLEIAPIDYYIPHLKASLQ
jgi:[1-hydroxy-2-(trimethylamino)ethyl]phosphonate dioxygenase